MTEQLADSNQSVYALPDLREPTQKESRILIAISVFFLVFHFIRTFGNNFWGDDAWTANMVQHSVSEIIERCQWDSHNPFYYLLVKGFCEVFGYNDWAYQFSSYVPYLIMMILSLTLVRKWFGIQTSILMAVMLSAVPISVNYITEVRMYEWAMLFVSCMMLSAYAFCQRQNLLNTALIVVFGLMAAYTHLYSLILAGMVVAAVIVIMVLKRKLVIVAVICTILAAGAIPMLIKAQDVFGKVSEDFWIKRLPYLFETIGYSYGDVLMTIPALLGFGFVVTVILYELGKSTGRISKYMVEGEGRRLSQIGCLLIIVLVPLVTTVLFGYVVSWATRPVFVLKYVYPALAGLWILTGVCMTRFRPDSKALIKFLVLLLVFAIPISGYNLGCEAVQCIDTADLLKATGDLGEGDNIITDYSPFSESVLEYYYPGAQVSLAEDGDFVDRMDPSKNNWLFIEGRLSDEQYQRFIEKGYGIETVKMDTHLAHYKVNVYRITS